MNKIKSLLNFIIPLALVVVISTGCAVNTGAKDDPEAQKYLSNVKAFCAKNNLKLDKYLGKTIIRGKDYKKGSATKEPVVYEWKVLNRQTKEELVVWVGPIMPMLPKLKPSISLGKGRYGIGTKVEELKSE